MTICKEPKKQLMRFVKNSSGQSTIEYALAMFAFLSIFIACSVLWRTLDEALFIEHAVKSASHHAENVWPGNIGDLFLF